MLKERKGYPTFSPEQLLLQHPICVEQQVAKTKQVEKGADIFKHVVWDIRENLIIEKGEPAEILM